MHTWMDRAICRNREPEVFFPEGFSRKARADAAKAKEICAQCPVTRECLDYALAQPWITDGIWAGLDVSELRRVARNRRRAARERLIHQAFQTVVN